MYGLVEGLYKHSVRVVINEMSSKERVELVDSHPL